MEQYRHAASRCPVCRTKITAATNFFEEEASAGAPEEGDLTVCLYCESFLVYGPRMWLTLLTAEEVGMLAG